MYEALDIAKYIVASYWKQGEAITNLKLQKILYYIQGYAYRNCRSAAFKDQICKWPYGPVVPAVYYQYSSFRAGPIAEPKDEDIKRVALRLSENNTMKNVIDRVISVSYQYTSTQLVRMTHAENPWKYTIGMDTIISKSDIGLYFSSNDPLNLE